VLSLSVLDQSTIVTGRSPDASIRESIRLAQFCESLGYDRYWCAEHHNSDSQAGTAPEILISRDRRHDTPHPGWLGRRDVAALLRPESRRTISRARRHRPRADRSGLGRAPGSDGRTAFALNPRADTRRTSFPPPCAT
jgi:hypothetical protein